MSTKFVSKNSNMMIVLKPGIPGSPITGQQMQPGVYVKFTGGVVEVKEDSIANMLRNHPKFNIDFVEVGDSSAHDPFDGVRQDSEPAHVIQEIKYGHIEKVKGTPRKVKIDPALQKAIKAEAARMAKEMVKDMIPALLKEAIRESSENQKNSSQVNEDKAE